ncbi:hypothetical protein JOF56_003267 [Kibdelosporangium banguiense]|uniref:Uncharacterized protein n=1 Tax=Kibdelosporangium banguiense TaxID=1365924 RepID=A0ABS4TEN9_9PSEU|nr:hypothetical protein [Kibdelosporangium banguiense]MBP2322882.1 hypothetical protein [Kibdelosporangium banguiense]
MRRKLLAGLFSLFAVVGFTPAAAATQDLPPPGCDVWKYDIAFGEGVSVFCDYLPYPPYMYRVVATCVAGSSLWYEYGYWVEQGLTSRAECQGGLLTHVPRVARYRIDER